MGRGLSQALVSASSLSSDVQEEVENETILGYDVVIIAPSTDSECDVTRCLVGPNNLNFAFNYLLRIRCWPTQSS